ncbi:hypothetical protein GCM10020331_063910 [Ectobacillus funiculus]
MVAEKVVTPSLAVLKVLGPLIQHSGIMDSLNYCLDMNGSLQKSPAGAHQWVAINPAENHLAPDAEDSSVRVPTMMTTADMALRIDPTYEKDFPSFL